MKLHLFVKRVFSAAAVLVVVTSVSGQSTGLLREYWTNIGDYTIDYLKSRPGFPDSPNGSEIITSFEGPVNWKDNYGDRLRGFISPGADGWFTFWISSDDHSQLWLSTDESPANKVLLAEVRGWCQSREWFKYPSQQSAAVQLRSGRKYYVEVLHKEAGGGDNVAVGWQGPGISGAAEMPIPGSRLTPWGVNLNPSCVTGGPVVISSLPYSIRASGSYILMDNLSTSGTGIRVDANDVTIDLNGFKITGTTIMDSNGIHINAADNVEIKNGTVSSFFIGVKGTELSGAVRLNNLRSVANMASGVSLDMRAENSLQADNCAFVHNGGFGIHTKHGTLTNVTADYNQVGIEVWDSVIKNSSARYNDVQGIVVYLSVVNHTVVSHNSIGIWADESHIKDNIAYDNTRDIQCYNDRSIVSGNLAHITDCN